MKRIICHWTAGGPQANDIDLAHYHEVINQDLSVSTGKHSIEDNINTSDGDYAAHTRGLNTDSIGLSCAGMAGAKESPLRVGKHPVNELQFDKMAERAAFHCRKYGIEVTPRTVLTHAEVQSTLGFRQRNKWDYTILPWNKSIKGAKACGDYLRDRVRSYLNIISEPEPKINKRYRWLQRLLIAKGYNPGAADGIPGPETEEAICIFQLEVGLPQTGKFDASTVAALRDDDEGAIKNSKPAMKSRTVGGAGAAGVGGAAFLVEPVQDTIQVIEGQRDALSGGDIAMLVIGLLVVGGALLALYARLDDGGYIDRWLGRV